jgi:GH24 family phage-related lysozyme (muramidase)
LIACIGITGKVGSIESEEKLKELVNSLSDCELSFPHALEIHENFTIPLYYARTRKTFVGLDSLPDDVKGAIVSLVFNRGTRLDGPKRTHMAKIAKLTEQYVRNKDPQILTEMADTFIDMAEIWKGEKSYEGLKRRRLAEAKLITDSI